MNPIGISNMPVDLNALPSANIERYMGKDLSDEEAKKATQSFESMFLHMMLNAMKETIPESGLLETGITKQIQDMFWFHLADELADQGGMGIGEVLYQQYKQSMGKAEAVSTLENEK